MKDSRNRPSAAASRKKAAEECHTAPVDRDRAARLQLPALRLDPDRFVEQRVEILQARRQRLERDRPQRLGAPGRAPEIGPAARIEVAFGIAPAFVEHDQRAGHRRAHRKQAAPVHRAAQRRKQRRVGGNPVEGERLAQPRERVRDRGGIIGPRRKQVARLEQFARSRDAPAADRARVAAQRQQRRNRAARAQAEQLAALPLDQRGQRGGEGVALCRPAGMGFERAPFVGQPVAAVPARKIDRARRMRRRHLRVSVCALEDMRMQQILPLSPARIARKG